MPSCSVRNHFDVEVHLLGGFDGESQHLPILQITTAGVEIQHVLSVDERALLFEQPDHAVFEIAFLPRSERENQIPLGGESLLLRNDECGSDRSGGAFVVGDAAAVQVALLLGQHERVSAPVELRRFNNIEVRVEDDRLRARLSAPPDHHVLTLWASADDHHIGSGKSCRTKSCSEFLCCWRRRSCARGGVDRDQFSQDRTRECFDLAVGHEHWRSRWCGLGLSVRLRRCEKRRQQQE